MKLKGVLEDGTDQGLQLMHRTIFTPDRNSGFLDLF